MMRWKFVEILLVFCSGISSDEKVHEGESEKPIATTDVVFVIRNEINKASIDKARKIKQRLLEEAEKLHQKLPTVLMLHEEWAERNAWAVLPMFETLYSKFNNKQWIFFCEDTTEIYLKGLLEVLAKFDSSKNWFLGHALYDKKPVIIHHFAFYHDLKSFPFPDFDAGWAISTPLLKRAAIRIRELEQQGQGQGFTIDVKYEVAAFLGNQKEHSDKVDQSANGTFLTHVEEFCINKQLQKNGCVSTVRYQVPNCGLVKADDILVAVKTCQKYHKDRVPVIQKTLGVHAENIRYYSDTIDKSIPTEYIGVKNTERGHCQKLHNIIKRKSLGAMKDKPWLVVVDDDTIMSFKRLQRLLACYDPTDAVVLGERYALNARLSQGGYSYPTGGGGMVLSRKAVELLLGSDCQCMSVDSPDDMWLGICANYWMRQHVLHTNSFHQAQPAEYNPKFLSHRFLVSFHKHREMDPMEIYKRYLMDPEEDASEKRTKNDEL